jgi:hypothetical protein
MHMPAGHLTVCKLEIYHFDQLSHHKSSQIIWKQAIFHTYLNEQRVNTESNHQLTALWLLLPTNWSNPATTATSRHCRMRLH